MKLSDEMSDPWDAEAQREDWVERVKLLENVLDAARAELTPTFGVISHTEQGRKRQALHDAVKAADPDWNPYASQG